MACGSLTVNRCRCRRPKGSRCEGSRRRWGWGSLLGHRQWNSPNSLVFSPSCLLLPPPSESKAQFRGRGNRSHGGGGRGGRGARSSLPHRTTHSLWGLPLREGGSVTGPRSLQAHRTTRCTRGPPNPLWSPPSHLSALCVDLRSPSLLQFLVPSRGGSEHHPRCSGPRNIVPHPMPPPHPGLPLGSSSLRATPQTPPGLVGSLCRLRGASNSRALLSPACVGCVYAPHVLARVAEGKLGGGGGSRSGEPFLPKATGRV